MAARGTLLGYVFTVRIYKFKITTILIANILLIWRVQFMEIGCQGLPKWKEGGNHWNKWCWLKNYFLWCSIKNSFFLVKLNKYHQERNKVKRQLDATRLFYCCIFSSTCFGYISPSSGALIVELQHMVFCTEFLDGWWSWEPLGRSCLRCGWCRASILSSKCCGYIRSIIRSIRCWVAAYGFLHRVFGWVVATESHGTIITVHTTYAAALKTTTHPKARCRKPYAATQHLMRLMMGVMYLKHVELRIHQ